MSQVAVMFFATAILTGWANTYTAPSAEESSVAATISSASPGDTVIIPPGTATWSTPLVVRDIKLLGSGTNLTVIIDNLDRNANPNPPLIFVHGTGSYTLEFGNFQLVGGNGTRNWHGEIAVDYTGPIRIHDIFYNLTNDKGLMLYGANLALVDHCYFKLKYGALLIRDTGYGDASWATSPHYGTALMPVIEDCYFTNTDHASTSDMVVDCEFGGRCTFRHNKVLYTYFEVHGTESGARQRGGRAFEVYSNSFQQDPAYNLPCINLRGGSGVFYGNTCSGTTTFSTINVNRATQRFSPWGGADGLTAWDDNAGTNFLSGTHSGPSGVNYLQVAGANWAVNQWVGYTVVNLSFTNLWRYADNFITNYTDEKIYNFSVITSNSTDKIFYPSSKDNGFMYFTNGHSFVINKVNHVLDQAGMGSGDLVVGDMQPWGPNPTVSTTGVAQWPHQVTEGIYSWNNTLNGANVGFRSGFPHCQLNRDYFNDTPKPGYTPLVYPHPLQGATNGPTNGGNTLQPPARVWVQY